MSSIPPCHGCSSPGGDGQQRARDLVDPDRVRRGGAGDGIGKDGRLGGQRDAVIAQRVTRLIRGDVTRETDGESSGRRKCELSWPPPAELGDGGCGAVEAVTCLRSACHIVRPEIPVLGLPVTASHPPAQPRISAVQFGPGRGVPLRVAGQGGGQPHEGGPEPLAAVLPQRMRSEQVDVGVAGHQVEIGLHQPGQRAGP